MQRILYVGMQADYGDVARGVSFEERNFHHPLRHFPSLIVEHFDFMAECRRAGRAAMSAALLAKVAEFEPHLLFLVGFDDNHDPAREVVREITETTETATLLWVCDDHWKFEGYSSRWAPVLDWIVTTDRDTLPRYEALGQGEKVILSQWGVNHRLYRPTYGLRDIAVSFVGQPHGDRPTVLEGLLRAGIGVQVYGHGWRRGIQRLPFHEMVRVFSRSRINLNLANSSKPASQQIKGRNFEVPGCHGFLLTQPVPHLEDYFDLGNEVVVFHDGKDLLDKIHYYLAHEDERRRIATLGHARCLREHTWDHRLQAIFDHIGLSQGSGYCKQQGAAQEVLA
ncbi:MAG: CgeB family protein [Planctomycetota bacterium]